MKNCESDPLSITSIEKGFLTHKTKCFQAKSSQLVEDGFLISVQSDNILLLTGSKKGSIFPTIFRRFQTCILCNRIFSFLQNIGTCRYIKFAVEGTKKLFNWHPSAGGGSWVFVDEVVVR